MHERIKSFFLENRIEYFSAIDINDVNIVNARLIERAGITARSAIIFLLPYYTGEADNLSVYAASLDYHIIIKRITGELCCLLSDIYPNNKFFGFGDHSPIDERHAALVAGLGILGDNGLLINEKYGTYIFVAEVIGDLPPEELGASSLAEIKRCEGCGACISACATGCLADYSKSCLSAITQKKGELSESEIALIKQHGSVWGCDLCQSSCPHNVNPVLTPIDFFYEERMPHLTYENVSALSEEDFEKRAFAWRGRKTVLRNLSLFEDGE